MPLAYCSVLGLSGDRLLNNNLYIGHDDAMRVVDAHV